MPNVRGLFDLDVALGRTRTLIGLGIEAGPVELEGLFLFAKAIQRLADQWMSDEWDIVHSRSRTHRKRRPIPPAIARWAEFGERFAREDVLVPPPPGLFD